MKRKLFLLFLIMLLPLTAACSGKEEEKDNTPSFEASSAAEVIPEGEYRGFVDVIPPAAGLPVSWMDSDAFYAKLNNDQLVFKKAVWTVTDENGRTKEMKDDDVFVPGKVLDARAYFYNPGVTPRKLDVLTPLTGEYFVELLSTAEGDWCVHWRFPADMEMPEAVLLQIPAPEAGGENTGQKNLVAVWQGEQLSNVSASWKKAEDRNYDRAQTMAEGEAFGNTGIYQTTFAVKAPSDASLSGVYCCASCGYITRLDDSENGIWKITVQFDMDKAPFAQKSLPKAILEELESNVPIADIRIDNPKVTKKDGPFAVETKVESGTVKNVRWYLGPDCTGTEMTVNSWKYSCEGYSAWYRIEMNMTGRLVAAEELNVSVTEGRVFRVDRIDGKTLDVFVNYAYVHELERDEKESVPASCDHEGTDVMHCANCFAEVRQPVPVIPHDYIQTDYRAPDCTNGGYAAVKCARCGYSYTVNYPANGHSYKYESDESGHRKVCTVCGDVAEEGVHQMVRDGDTGIETCTVCGYSIQGEPDPKPTEEPGGGEEPGSEEP